MQGIDEPQIPATRSRESERSGVERSQQTGAEQPRGGARVRRVKAAQESLI